MVKYVDFMYIFKKKGTSLEGILAISLHIKTKQVLKNLPP